MQKYLNHLIADMRQAAKNLPALKDEMRKGGLA